MKQNGKKVSQNGTEHLLELEKKVDDMKKKYSRFLEDRERRRRRKGGRGERGGVRGG